MVVRADGRVRRAWMRIRFRYIRGVSDSGNARAAFFDPSVERPHIFLRGLANLRHVGRVVTTVALKLCPDSVFIGAGSSLTYYPQDSLRLSTIFNDDRGRH